MERLKISSVETCFNAEADHGADDLASGNNVVFMFLFE